MLGISATFLFVCNPLHFLPLAIWIMKYAPLGPCPALKLLNIWPFPLESRCFSLKNWISVSSFMHHVFGTVSGSSCSSQQGHCETHLLYTLPPTLPGYFSPLRRWRCPDPLGSYLAPCGRIPCDPQWILPSQIPKRGNLSPFSPDCCWDKSCFHLCKHQALH